MKRFLEKLRKVAREKIIYTLHALDEMNSEEEIISYEEIREVIFKGEVIEDYPDDKRGHSCLLFGFTSVERPLHIVCSPKEDCLVIITVYIPDLNEWKEDFKSRRTK